MTLRIRPLLPYLRRHRRPLLVGVVSIALANLLGLLTPWFLKQAIDGLTLGRLDQVTRASLLMLGTAVIAGGFRYLMRSRMIGASREIEYELREDFARHALGLSPSFYDRHKVGEIMALATNDLNAIRMLLGPGIMYLVDTVVTTVVALLLMAKLSPLLCLVAFAPMPVLGLFFQQITSRVHTRFTQVQEQFADLSSFAQESLTGIRIIKSYAREPRMAERFQDQSRAYLDRNLGFVKLQSLMHPLMALLAGVASALTLYIGGRQVVSGTITVGTLVAFLSYLALLTWPAIAAGWTVNIWQRGVVSLQRVEDILRTVSEVADVPNAKAWQPRRGRVEFAGVSFAYPGSTNQALHQVSLGLQPGTWTAVVGPTGAGKTTLVRLLARQYDRYDGSILLDGHELRSLRLSDLRAGTGYAPQDGFLFSDTLRENIVFGAPDLDDAAVDALARVSRLERDKGAFPQGWQTLIGERGVTLSGGQKQRVSIARALAADPTLLLLDDVFSSVDTETESELLEQLRGAWRGRTVLLVTHRLLGVQGADQILVMDKGSVVERGTHATLQSAGGLYESLFRRQMAEAELDALGGGRA